jgi:hypothetical protein
MNSSGCLGAYDLKDHSTGGLLHLQRLGRASPHLVSQVPVDFRMDVTVKMQRDGKRKSQAGLRLVVSTLCARSSDG